MASAAMGQGWCLRFFLFHLLVLKGNLSLLESTTGGFFFSRGFKQMEGSVGTAGPCVYLLLRRE